jgi:hypothetical protein
MHDILILNFPSGMPYISDVGMDVGHLPKSNILRDERARMEVRHMRGIKASNPGGPLSLEVAQKE